MPKKSGISRRQFIGTTSAAALGAAAMSGKEAVASTEVPQAFRSRNGSLIPYSRADLLPPDGKPRTLPQFVSCQGLLAGCFRMFYT